MKEYIDKAEAVERALYTPIMSNGPVKEKDVDAWTDGAADAQDQIAKSIGKIPAADVVSRAAFDQVMWERDTAIQQLREDYGVDLGEKKAADVVERKRGKWKRTAITDTLWCMACNKIPDYQVETDFCPNCGADMREVDHD